MTPEQAKKIMGKNFIGSAELNQITQQLHIAQVASAPEIPYSGSVLEKYKTTHLLILGVAKDSQGHPLTIVQLRKLFGVDPAEAEPCLYNQDWYLKEPFAATKTLENKWYLIAKTVTKETRAVDPKKIKQELSPEQTFPSAILTAFAFFANYFISDELLWQHDFVWCADADANGDQIYTGRYEDPKGINKNGFNIHRHLSLRSAYGSVTLINP